MAKRKRNTRYDISIRENDGTWKNIGYHLNGVYCRKIKGSKHIYKKTNSIGIDARIFLEEIRLYCTEIRILDIETKTLYVCRVKVFDTMKSYLHFKPHRAQVFLPIKHFKQINKNQ